MAAQDTSKFSESFSMKGGDGPNSYASNSFYQRKGLDYTKQLVVNEIAEKLDIEKLLLSANTFYVADLGCSTGPNTFSAVESIVEAVHFKYQSQRLVNSKVPEYQVYFNDHTANDFNMLFKSLPQNRQYYAVGVPGSFYGRLFPSSSIHFFHSSFSVHWLSRVPKEVVDRNSRAWNKGRIFYSTSSDEVARAYEAQHAEDMKCFLHARAQEMVHGGLMVLILAGRLDGTPHSQSMLNAGLELIGTCLMHMARKGVILEEKVDSFNIPMYCMCPQELITAVEQNGCFSIERMEYLPRVPAVAEKYASHMRASFEGLINQHFGEEILDELFDLYTKKLEEQPLILGVESDEATHFLAALKRKAN